MFSCVTLGDPPPNLPASLTMLSLAPGLGLGVLPWLSVLPSSHWRSPCVKCEPYLWGPGSGLGPQCSCGLRGGDWSVGSRCPRSRRGGNELRSEAGRAGVMSQEQRPCGISVSQGGRGTPGPREQKATQGSRPHLPLLTPELHQGWAHSCPFRWGLGACWPQPVATRVVGLNTPDPTLEKRLLDPHQAVLEAMFRHFPGRRPKGQGMARQLSGDKESPLCSGLKRSHRPPRAETNPALLSECSHGARAGCMPTLQREQRKRERPRLTYLNTRFLPLWAPGMQAGSSCPRGRWLIRAWVPG